METARAHVCLRPLCDAPLGAGVGDAHSCSLCSQETLELHHDFLFHLLSWTALPSSPSYAPTSELNFHRCKLPSETPPVLNYSVNIRKGNRWGAKESKCVLYWIDSWTFYQVPNNLIITDLVFMGFFLPMKVLCQCLGREVENKVSLFYKRED